jgi:GDP-L-fucose synthase
MNSKYFFPLEGARIFVAGHQGFLGSSICRRLEKENVKILSVSKDEVDLTRQTDVENWMNINRPDVVIIAAAKVGGIYANNNYPAEFIYQNLAIEQNLIHASHLTNVKKLIMLGSSCSYPNISSKPIPESALMDGKPELTNQWYAVAKISGIKLCEAYRKQYGHDFISILPANLYGPGDNFDYKNSHVIPGLIQRFHKAKNNTYSSEIIWGSGKPLREFMYVDDASDAIIFLMKNYSDDSIINIGTGQEINIKQLSHKVAKLVRYHGQLVFDTSKPDGSLRKVLDISKLHSMGWKHRIGIDEGLELTYHWFQKNLTFK